MRTKNGIIDKVENYSIGCCVWHCQNGMCIDKCNCIGTHLEEIVKHSKQLIDLIEVGDIVNGFPVLEPIYNGNVMYGIDEGYENFKKSFGDIKTILTKEQYEANCYKVGGEKC